MSSSLYPTLAELPWLVLPLRSGCQRLKQSISVQPIIVAVGILSHFDRPVCECEMPPIAGLPEPDVAFCLH